MTPIVFCKPSNGVHSFYVNVGSETYFLFSQDFRSGVQRFYSKGVPLHQATDYTKAKRNRAVYRTMRKIPMYIRYIEKEYDISILNQTKKKKAQCRHKRNECA